jgi:hypothetical protein
MFWYRQKKGAFVKRFCHWILVEGCSRDRLQILKTLPQRLWNGVCLFNAMDTLFPKPQLFLQGLRGIEHRFHGLERSEHVR